MAPKKGNIPWNKGKKCPQISQVLLGNQNALGARRSKETRRKISVALKGRRFSEETRRKMSEARMGVAPWNTGKKCPKISMNQKGENNSFYGGKHTEETKCKMSIRMSGKNNPNYGKRGQIPWNIGKKLGPLSEDHKRKISEGNKGKTVSEEAKQKMRAARLKQIFPAKDTSIEAALQDELNSRNISFVKHVPVCDVCQPDIVFLDKRVAVFADGIYWHSKEFDGGNVWRRDRCQDRVLKENGWAVLRFWGSEIREDVSRCVDNIEALLG